jgi:hypothetical protein
MPTCSTLFRATPYFPRHPYEQARIKAGCVFGRVHELEFALRGAERRGEATSQAQEDISPASDRPSLFS